MLVSYYPHIILMEYVKSLEMNDQDFIKHFENRAEETISQFKLFSRNDMILVAASGGKDSTALLHLMKKLGYNISAITVNAHIGCYSDESLSRLKEFCSLNKIKLHEISFKKEFGHSLCNAIALLEEKGIRKTSCSVCGSLRRYLLNKYSRKLNADVLLTGHNLDDEANGALVSLFSGNLNHTARTGPLADCSSFVSKAKPFYFLFEEEVVRYSKLNNFNVSYHWCPCSVKGARRFYAEAGINGEEKFNLIQNLLFYQDKLKKYFKSGGIKGCSVCGEPSSNLTCQACKILSMIKSDSIEEDTGVKNERLCAG